MPIGGAKYICKWGLVCANCISSLKREFSADALSHNLQGELLSSSLNYDVQVAMVDNTTLLMVDSEISQLLQQEGYGSQTVAGTDLGTAQQEDPELHKIIQFLCSDILPDDHIKVKNIAA